MKTENTDSIDIGWYLKRNTVIKVYDKKGKLDYYLVDNYNQDIDYFLELKNREYLSLRTKKIIFGAVSIPFKYRFSFKENDIEVDSEFTTDFNAGVFGGYNIGRYRVRYENKELKELANISFTFGPFLSLSTTEINDKNTTLATIPLEEDESKTIGLFSPGMGAMITVYNFNFGVFGGWDFGYGGSAKKWNYNDRFWLGFGIGYNITSSFLK